jgi:hypothetical protein
VTHVIQNGGFFLQGWIGWGSMCCAQSMPEKWQTKMLEKVKKAGYGNAVVVPKATCTARCCENRRETPCALGTQR